MTLKEAKLHATYSAARLKVPHAIHRLKQRGEYGIIKYMERDKGSSTLLCVIYPNGREVKANALSSRRKKA